MRLDRKHGSQGNLKKYTAVDGAWRFVPVLKINGRPRPEVVVIDGATVRGTTGRFYVEWRQKGKRIQKPCGSSSREALDARRTQVALLNGEIDEPEEEDSASLPLGEVLIQSAADDFLESVKATKGPATYEAYSSDLDWFRANLQRTTVGRVTRKDIIRLFGTGRDQGQSQATINRKVMVGLMALRQAGALARWPNTISAHRRDSPPSHSSMTSVP